MSTKCLNWVLLVIFLQFMACCANISPRTAPDFTSSPTATGRLFVSFVFMPPGETYPTYHSAMWLENESGELVRTLYVSRDLSDIGYKSGDACPDWVEQAHWEKAEKSLVDAVTGPTPNVGSASMTFDLNELDIAPRTYRFCYQVNFIENYNILNRGMITLGGSADEAEIEVLYSPSKAEGAEDVVRYVQVRYLPD